MLVKFPVESYSPYKVGALLVNAQGEIVGEGYNDLPKKGLPWSSKAKNRWQTKTPYGMC